VTTFDRMFSSTALESDADASLRQLTYDSFSAQNGRFATEYPSWAPPPPSPPSPPPSSPPPSSPPPLPPTPPPADVCDCDDAAASDECKETCDAIGAAGGIVGAALTLVIALPIVGCLLVALLVALVVYCCCCKKAAAGAPAPPTAVESTKTAV